MIEQSDVFQVLAHVDFPRRYWPGGTRRFVEKDYEEEYRAVFRALAGTGRALEINTSSPLASADQVRWFHDEGGEAVSFGSDAHQPTAGRAEVRPRRRRRRGGRLPAGPRPVRLLAPLSVRRVRDATDRTTPRPARRSTRRTSSTRRSRSSTSRRRPPTMAGRIAAAQRAHAWLVLEDDGRVVGLRLRRPAQGARRVRLGVRGERLPRDGTTPRRWRARAVRGAAGAAGRARLPRRRRRA